MDNELCYYSYTDGQVEGEVKVFRQSNHIEYQQTYVALRSQVKTVDVAYYDDDDDVDDEILR